MISNSAVVGACSRLLRPALIPYGEIEYPLVAHQLMNILKVHLRNPKPRRGLPSWQMSMGWLTVHSAAGKSGRR